MDATTLTARFVPPPEWHPIASEEAGVTAYAAGAAHLNLIGERRPSAGPDEGLAKLREWALLYLRPDDGRVGDRELLPLDGRGWLASATLRDGAGDDAVTCYLWFVGRIAEDTVIEAVMAAVLVPQEAEGEPDTQWVLSQADAAIRALGSPA